VTLNGTEDGYDGIIWKISDGEYSKIRTRWCYASVEEALKERGDRFRRPYTNQGRPRP
jgi:hypothetical protein